MKLSGELDYRIRYDVEHDLFHAQNVFSDEYIKPTFIEYVQELEEKLTEKVILESLDVVSARIKGLEKENAELREELNYAKTHCLFHSDCPTQKENAELKNKLEHRNCLDCSNHHSNIKLFKAKKLLKQWLQTSKASGCDNINIVTDTEQFLSEVEK